MSRKVLIFSLAYYPRYIGGAEVAVREITQRIPEEEYSFDMITLRGAGDPAFEKVGAVNVYRIGIPGLYDKLEPLEKGSTLSLVSKILYVPLAFFEALKLQKKNSYDIVWSIMAAYAGLASVLFTYIYPLPKYIVTLQEGIPIQEIVRQMKPVYPLFRKIFARASRVHAISTFLKRFAGTMGALCPVEVVPNGVDVSLISAPVPASNIARAAEAMNKKPTSVCVITTSRLTHKNGIDTLIDSLVYLPEHVHLAILGSGELETELKQRAALKKVQHRVKFLGQIPHEEMAAYLQAADIFARPSRSEGLGNSFLEAMAAGLPVIATNIGGIPDFLTDGVTGIFAEIDSPESVAECIELYIHDQKLRRKVVVAGYEMVHKQYNWSTVAQSFKTKVLDAAMIQPEPKLRNNEQRA